MQLFSHKDPENKKSTKLLNRHITSVKENMLQLMYKQLGFETYKNITEIICLAGMYHDFGKATSYFQKYLDDEYNGEKKNHSLLSAVFSFNYSNEVSLLTDIEKYFLYYIVKNHHSNLSSLSADKFIFNLNTVDSDNIISYQVKDLLARKDSVEENIGVSIKSIFFDLNFKKQIKKIVRKLTKKNVSIENYFFINYVFSLLIEADKLDASYTLLREYKTISQSLVEDYIRNNFKDKTLDDKRNKARFEIEKSLENIDLKTDKIFSITAPTGIGKTLSVLNFALKLKDKIYINQKHKAQIIYCLPFINIIDQTDRVLNKLFAHKNINIIKHHSYSDIFSNAEVNKNSSYNFENYKMLTETWQGEIVLTTFVQFCHTLIGNKNRSLKKFSHLAGSIIILDEVQALDCKFWPLIGASLYYLTKYLNSKIILMTATQPRLFTNLDILGIKKEVKPKELLPEYKRYFSMLKRTQLIPSLQNEMDNEKFIEYFQEIYNKKSSCLVVLNTIKRSKDIFIKLKKTYNKDIEKKAISFFYLSTSIVPKKRMIIIKKVKRLLKENKPVVLISTQSIEAGVDLDFDMGIRDIGPIDSIIQVAGRINREDNLSKEHSPLYIVDFGKDSKNVYGEIIPLISRKILENRSKILEEEYRNLVTQYFEDLSYKEKQDKEIFRAMETLSYSDYEDHKGINNFKLINERANFIDVFVDFYAGDCSQKHILNRYLKAKSGSDKEQVLKLKKYFSQYTISCDVKNVSDLPEYCKIYDELYYVPNDMLEIYYDKETGMIKKENASSLIL